MKKINLSKITIDIPKLMKLINPINCILDIGCAHAEERKVFRKLTEYFKGPIYYFETDPRWKKELDLIEKEENSFVVRKVVCEIDGEVELLQNQTHMNIIKNKWVTYKNWKYSSTIKQVTEKYKNKWRLTYKDKPITVPSITLDSWAKDKDLGEIDLIWMPVSGSEGEVLLGGMNTINKTRYIYMTYTAQCFLKDAISFKEIKNNILSNFSVIYTNKNYVLFKREY